MLAELEATTPGSPDDTPSAGDPGPPEPDQPEDGAARPEEPGTEGTAAPPPAGARDDDAANQAPESKESGAGVVEPSDPGDATAAPDTSGSEVAHLAYELFDGGARTLGHYHGRPLVVNFFSSTCPPCIVEMPDFQRVFERLGDEVAFLGLSVDPDPDDSLWVIERTGVTYDLGSDARSDVFRALDGLAMPTSVFISRDGIIVERFSGRLLEPDLLTLIEAARA